MNQTRLIASFSKDAGNQFLPANAALADQFDLNTGGLADLLRRSPDKVAQGLAKTRVVENADAAQEPKAGHPARETRSWQSTGHDDPVVARQHTMPIRRVPIRQCRCGLGRSPQARFGSNRIAGLVLAREHQTMTSSESLSGQRLACLRS
jgi:hypothetical protein